MTDGRRHGRRSGRVAPGCVPARLLAAGLLLGPLLPGTGVAGDGWRCEASVATAYRQDPATRRWQTLVIPVTDQRFRVRPASVPGRWELVREGDDGPALPCAGDFEADGLLRCGAGDSFGMNRNRLTFISHLFGPASKGLEQLTAATVTGTCVAL